MRKIVLPLIIHLIAVAIVGWHVWAHSNGLAEVAFMAAVASGTYLAQRLKEYTPEKK